MSTPIEQGPRAGQIQRHLLDLGYHLPRYGADGVISAHGETWQALADFASDHVPVDLGADGLSTGREYDLIVSALLVMPVTRQPVRVGAVDVIDITDTHKHQHVHGIRSWDKVDAIVLHQTAYLMDSEAEWRTLRAHIGVPQGADSFYLVNPLNGLMWHANGFNGYSVGIEVSGLFPGLVDDPRTVWRPSTGYDPRRHGPHRLSEQQRDATRAAIRFVVDEVARHGGKITHCFAHRQASKDRIADPGEEIWRQCGEWARDELGLSAGDPGFKIGGGYPLPEAWGFEGGVKNYWSSKA